MTTPAEDFVAIVAESLAFPGAEEDAGFRVLETHAIGTQAVVVGEAIGNAAVVGYAQDAVAFASLFDNIAVAADAFAQELREPGGSGETPTPATVRVIAGRHPGIQWVTPLRSLHAVLTDLS